MKKCKRIVRILTALLLMLTLCVGIVPQKQVKAAGYSSEELEGWTEWFSEPQTDYENDSYLREEKTEKRYRYSRFLWYGPSKSSSTVTYRAASFRHVPSGWTLNKVVTTNSYSGARDGKYNVRYSDLFITPVTMSSSGGWNIGDTTYWQEDEIDVVFYRYSLTNRIPHYDYLDKDHDVEYCGNCGTKYSDTNDRCSSCGSYRIHKMMRSYQFGFPSNVLIYYDSPEYDGKKEIAAPAYMVANIKTRNISNVLMLGLLYDNDIHFFDVHDLILDFNQLANDAYSMTRADSTEGLLYNFIQNFKPNTYYDVKSAHNLGNKDQIAVLMDNNNTVEYLYGEEIGNILYGYVAAKCGITFKNAILFGGLPNGILSWTYNSTMYNYGLGDLEKVDSADDIINEALGYQYGQTGVWSNQLSEQFLAYHSEIKDIHTILCRALD